MNSPLSLFTNAGAGAQQISPLLWGLIVLSIGVVVIIGIAVLAAIVVRSRGRHDPAAISPEHSRGGMWLIYGGTAISTLVLIGFIGWTLTTMVATSSPPQPAAFTVDVTGEQWWWQLAYEAVGPAPGFTTANELHIPVGKAVHFHITASDVIHSFWVPALGGKTDAIPGQVNDMWLEADKPSIYRGQCAEYCGVQHAQMALLVVAEPQAQFEAWRAQQATDARPAADPAGDLQFVLSCGKCHNVRGTAANGTDGPDLTHLMSRTTIAAGMLENNPGNLAGWIANPQGLKPGAKMPGVPLSGAELQAVLTYLETLS